MPKLDPESMVRHFFKKLPKMPEGEIDYSNSNTAVVVTVFVQHRDKVLLVKRSQKVSGYRGKWNSISGYVDQVRPIKEIALKELGEEIGLKLGNIAKITAGKVYSFTDKNEGKRWVVCPYLAQTKKKPKVKLDWENTQYRWIDPKQIGEFDIVPHLDESLSRSLGKSVSSKKVK